MRPGDHLELGGGGFWQGWRSHRGAAWPCQLPSPTYTPLAWPHAPLYVVVSALAEVVSLYLGAVTGWHYPFFLKRRYNTMAKKRGNNEGSITRRKDGRWEARISLGRDTTGKVKRMTLYGKT